MHYAANAYSKVAQATQSPRELEALILMKAATRLQAIRDDWDGRAKRTRRRAHLQPQALDRARLVGHTPGEPASRQPIKQNIANLGLFIFNHTLSLMSDPKPERLAILVTINREIAAGLRGMGVPETPAVA